MNIPPILHTYQRIRTLRTHRITALPVVILMPHSACNCRCTMCDIWQDNKNLKQLTEADLNGLLPALKKLGAQNVLMSGGEALLNPNFFRLCAMLKEQGISVTLLSTGLTIKKHAEQIINLVDNLILSLDGDEPTHDMIRNIPNAFAKLRDGVEYIKALKPTYRITVRTVIHAMNFERWPAIIAAAKNMGIDQVSFLPADVSSHAFNRQTAWAEPRQHEILPAEAALPRLEAMVNELLETNRADFESGYIAENPQKFKDIYNYYAACYGHNAFPFKKCNAPWVSTVVEADGSVRPCFFHDVIGNIYQDKLEGILNSPQAIAFRKNLNMSADDTCSRCVCSLNLSPFARVN